MIKTCLHCKEEFTPILEELCCSVCATKNEYQCISCKWTDRTNNVLDDIFPYCEDCYFKHEQHRLNTCDLCRVEKHSWLIGTGKCETCGFYTDMCYNCMAVPGQDGLCAKCRTHEWRIQPVPGNVKGWLQASLPGVEIKFRNQE
jgi:hypothetical protein